MNHFVWSNSLLLGAMLIVLGGLKFVGSSTTQGRKTGAGMIALAVVLMLTFSGRYFGRDEPSLAALVLIVVTFKWMWTTDPSARRGDDHDH